jgi:hypothetical protein
MDKDKENHICGLILGICGAIAMGRAFYPILVTSCKKLYEDDGIDNDIKLIWIAFLVGIILFTGFLLYFYPRLGEFLSKVLVRAISFVKSLGK